MGRNPRPARRQQDTPVCPPGNLAVARTVLVHRPVPLPSSPHRCYCIFRRGPAWAGSLSICACCLQNHGKLVQTQPSRGPTAARGSSNCPAALYTAWENCCPTAMEAKVLLDFCRIQRKCKSELHVWAACLERCLCPRSCKRSSARWSSWSWETTRGAHPSDTCSGAPVLCAHALPPSCPAPSHVLSGHAPLWLPPDMS